MPFLNSHALADSNPLILKFDDWFNFRVFFFTRIYNYPNEDICLFREFPHHRSVMPCINPGQILPCTCTLKWIQLNIRDYSNYLNLTTDYDLIINAHNEGKFDLSRKILTFNFCPNDTLVTCNFEALFNRCVSFRAKKLSFSLNNDREIYNLIRWIQFILLIILNCPYLAR